MGDRQAFKTDLAAVLQRDVPAAELDSVVSRHFPALNVFRENEDLILIRIETHRLLIRRVGRDLFRVSENAAASGSTNLLDLGGDSERDLDALIDEIAAFAAH